MPTPADKTEVASEAVMVRAPSADWSFKKAASGRLARGLCPLLIPPALAGCAARSAPSFVLFGAYFPAWMFCALVGIVAAIAARTGFVMTGLASVLPYQLFVCVAIGVCVALAFWLIRFA